MCMWETNYHLIQSSAPRVFCNFFTKIAMQHIAKYNIKNYYYNNSRSVFQHNYKSEILEYYTSATD